MLLSIDTSLIDWSRAQFALTAMYHWLFVPLTLGLGIIVSIMETLYVVRKDEFWKRTAQFWMKLFGINFAVGVATGLILEFEFGTNWSNYSWIVGDIFGAPLAIEGIVAFFMEATFISIMFFGWNKVSRKFHLASTWLTVIGATVSAWWILVANAWMQRPVGVEFNPETVRNEMTSFAEVALSPMAVTKFLHTVTSGWLTGAVFVVGISSWYLLKKRHIRFAQQSLVIGAIFGVVSTLAVIGTGDRSGVEIARYQPMKLAAFEGLQKGSDHAPFTVAGPIKIPNMLTVLATHQWTGFVPGIDDLIEGGYRLEDNTRALSAVEKMKRGRTALQALSDYRSATQAGDMEKATAAEKTLKAEMPYFGYGKINHPQELVPPVNIVFWSFRIMVGLGGLFLLLFIAFTFLHYRRMSDRYPWLWRIAVACIPLVYICGQAGWVCAEVGRQPWAIQDMLPVSAAVSALPTGNVQLTFFVFLALFTLLLVAEIRILTRAIKKGPSGVDEEGSPIAQAATEGQNKPDANL